MKELKQSTRQRFIGLDFEYPPPSLEQQVLEQESGIDSDLALRLVKAAGKIRNLTSRGLEEGVSTRLLVHAARLMQAGIGPRLATQAAFERTLSDDLELQASIRQVVADYFEI